MNVEQKNKGFTIIEVVLVLAIAGLIFLVVFLALPALQRSQRDTQRRSDVGRIVAALQSYQSNTNGTLPTFTPTDQWNGALKTGYLQASGAKFEDPSFASYSFAASTTTPPNTLAPTTSTNGVINVVIGRTCDGTAKNRAASVVIGLENGGSYCANN